MGILEFFGTLVKNGITASAIQSNYEQSLATAHLLIDFNSIIHVASQKVLLDVNLFMQTVLVATYEHTTLNTDKLHYLFDRYRAIHLKQLIESDPIAQKIVTHFHHHFNEKYLDKLVIGEVIHTLLTIVQTFGKTNQLKTLLLAFDGVPSKGKMMEQRQRRYLGAITEAYETRLLRKYKEYLLTEPNYIYLATRYAIQWSRNKITPGTFFMDKLARYLNDTKIQLKLKRSQKQMIVVVNDTNHLGEGEKKIVNYVHQYLQNTSDSVTVYSPDADMILLCMLMPLKQVYMLRYNQQTSNTDLIDILHLKEAISYYVNQSGLTYFDVNSVNRDIVCISTLFGNDFVPKIETLNVKRGFQTVMDAYLKTLKHFSVTTDQYLVMNFENQYILNFHFLLQYIEQLLPEEADFIKHNPLYNRYIQTGLIKYVFEDSIIDQSNIVTIVHHFQKEYTGLKNAIKSNNDLTYYQTNHSFIQSLKRCILIVVNGEPVNVSYLTAKQLIAVIIDYYNQYNQFPRLTINLNTRSNSMKDFIHQKATEGLNAYQKEKYQFIKMLDEYHLKFNAQPLDLTKDKVNDYYKRYFHISLLQRGRLSDRAKTLMHTYVEGIVWVFQYYFNDSSYINRWYYPHERAPLLLHIYRYLQEMQATDFNQISVQLKKYRVKKTSSYFSPIEQLIYVSPITPTTLKLYPAHYVQFLTSSSLPLFLQNYFLDINQIVNDLWNQKVSTNMDCRSIPYFNKCNLAAITKPSATDDIQFLKYIRRVNNNVTTKER